MNGAEWTMWISGWRARPLDDVTGYRSEAEIDAVSTVNALSTAVQLHITKAGRNAGPDVQQIGEATLEMLRVLQQHDPQMFVEYSAALLGLPMRPSFSSAAYATWLKRQETVSGG